MVDPTARQWYPVRENIGDLQLQRRDTKRTVGDIKAAALSLFLTIFRFCFSTASRKVGR